MPPGALRLPGLRIYESDLYKRVIAPGATFFRFPFSVFRFPVYGLRFTVYGLRFTVYGLRFTVYGLRFTEKHWWEADSRNRQRVFVGAGPAGDQLLRNEAASTCFRRQVR